MEKKGRTIQFYRKMNDFANLKYEQNGKDYRKYKDTTFFRRLCEEIGIKSSMLEDARNVVNKYNEAEQRGDKLYLACLDKAIAENSYSTVARLSCALRKATDDTMRQYLKGEIYANNIIENTYNRKSTSNTVRSERTIREICREMKDPDYSYTSTPDDVVMLIEEYAKDLLFCLESMMDDEHDYKQAMLKLDFDQKNQIRRCLGDVSRAKKKIIKYL